MFHISFPDADDPFVLISLFNFGAISEPPEPPSCEPPSFLHDTRPKTVSNIFGDIKPEEKKENKGFKLLGELLILRLKLCVCVNVFD